MEGCRGEGTRRVEGVMERKLEGCDERPLASGGWWERGSGDLRVGAERERQRERERK